jgi:hypothetical protein
MFCVYLHVLISMRLFQEKTTLYVVYVKMTKFGTKISFFHDVFFFLFTEAIKISIFYENLREHAEYGDIHAYIYF